LNEHGDVIGENFYSNGIERLFKLLWFTLRCQSYELRSHSKQNATDDHSLISGVWTEDKCNRCDLHKWGCREQKNISNLLTNEASLGLVKEDTAPCGCAQGRRRAGA